MAEPRQFSQPGLVLLHGATLNGRMWDPVRRMLDRRWQVITPDLPGHGTRRDEPYTLSSAADAVLGAALSAGGPIVLAGDSLGGYSAMAAAARLPPSRLKGLILGGCTVNFIGGPLRALRWRGRLGAWTAKLYGEQRFVRTHLTKLLGSMGHGPQDIEALIQGGVHIGAFAQAVQALANVNFLPRVAAIVQPILFFNGTRDKPAMAHEADFLAAAPDAESQHFDCEHGASLRKAHEFAAMTDKFMSRVCGVFDR